MCIIVPRKKCIIIKTSSVIIDDKNVLSIRCKNNNSLKTIVSKSLSFEMFFSYVYLCKNNFRVCVYLTVQRSNIMYNTNRKFNHYHNNYLFHSMYTEFQEL